jgi:hypothetical protein
MAPSQRWCFPLARVVLSLSGDPTAVGEPVPEKRREADRRPCPPGWLLSDAAMVNPFSSSAAGGT